MKTQTHTKLPVEGADYNTPMVSVAQLVERRTVNAEVAGSIPVGHPTVMSYSLRDYDRTWMCSHDGMLTKAKPDGTRLCVRCGKILKVSPPKRERFMMPINGSVDGQTKRIPR